MHRVSKGLWQGDEVAIDVDVELAAFLDAGRRAGLWESDPVVATESLPAPHRPPSRLREGCSATYVFSLSSAYGETCEAGPNRVLKVGMVGPKSAARFTSQHYLPSSAGSNVAKSLITERLLWPFLGVEYLDASNVKSWMLENLERDHFFFDPNAQGLERQFEKFVRGRHGPVFEG